MELATGAKIGVTFAVCFCLGCTMGASFQFPLFDGEGDEDEVGVGEEEEEEAGAVVAPKLW